MNYLEYRKFVFFFLWLATLLKLCKSEDTMRASVLRDFGDFSELHVENIPIPTITDDQVLVQVKAASVNPVDTYMRAGSYPTTCPVFPIILGKELSGTIEEVGSSVTKFEIGDRVFCGVEYGAYAEFAAANATHCFRMPANLTFSQGAAIFVTYFTAYRGIVLKGGLRRGGSLLVHGTNGNIGIPAIHIAKAIGAYVVATVGARAYEEIAENAGADYIVNHNIENYLTAAVNNIPHNELSAGFDVILEIIRTANLKNDKRYLNRNGLIIVLGSQSSIAVKHQYLRPGKRAADSVSLFTYTLEEMNDAADFMVNALEQGLIVPSIEQEYPLEDAAVAHADITRVIARGKLVLLI